jgi:hydrogenase expression/formation protein HypC
MCVSYPACVLALEDGDTALVEVRGGHQRRVVLLGTGPVAPGDWLVVHSGIALARIDADEARLRQQLIDRATGDGS